MSLPSVGPVSNWRSGMSSFPAPAARLQDRAILVTSLLHEKVPGVPVNFPFAAGLNLCLQTNKPRAGERENPHDIPQRSRHRQMNPFPHGVASLFPTEDTRKGAHDRTVR